MNETDLFKIFFSFYQVLLLRELLVMYCMGIGWHPPHQTRPTESLTLAIIPTEGAEQVTIMEIMAIVDI